MCSISVPSVAKKLNENRIVLFSYQTNGDHDWLIIDHESYSIQWSYTNAHCNTFQLQETHSKVIIS